MGRRHAALALSFAAALAGAYAGIVEPRRLVVRRTTLRLPGWPPRLSGLRVAVVADLHAGAPHIDAHRVGRIVARINACGPDLVALLGDYVDPKVKLGTTVAPEAVAARLGALRAPLGVFAVLGNHDWETDGERVRAALRSAGVTVLENDAVTAAGRDLWIAGVADERTRNPQPQAAIAAVPDGAALLVLSHPPDVFPRVPDRAALVLAGHTHGGQANIPLVRRWVIPSRFGDRYARGHVKEDGRHLYVSVGVGTSGWPVRLLAPPEMPVLTLVGAGLAA